MRLSSEGLEMKKEEQTQGLVEGKEMYVNVFSYN